MNFRYHHLFAKQLPIRSHFLTTLILEEAEQPARGTKEIVAEMVEHASTVTVPFTGPKMAPADKVRTNAAAMGTICRVVGSKMLR